ncbi:flagellar motor switch protein FliN/FliY [Palleronia aestuarii]|uniref:Flagellar motor switch protein FliN/FliY n=1 Tax=Palleronia aestuarii TaxID=568105 RepID=A0A2W7N4T7_9RHOB|nr:FliM/FliN family flagellar motor switch protein [Palleronia aestuarii]PZX15091.1 flagellar motor switch protein FliN/FliY [Palleronia aestuarii]
MDDQSQDFAPAQTDMAAPGASHPFSHLPIEIVVAVGKARPKLSELLRMGRDAVLALDTKVDDPVELYVGDRLIARGELQELDGDEQGQLAVRLTEVADLKSEL